MTRIEKLREKLPEGWQAALIQEGYNRAYLTRFESSAGWLLVTPASAWLLVDFRYYEMAREKAEGAEVLLVSEAYEKLGEFFKEEGVSRLMIENTVSIAGLASLKKAFPELKLDCDSALSDAISGLRMIKDESEIASIKAAQAITDAAFSHICTLIKPGMTELEVAAELEYFMRRNGADAFAFETICVSGARSSMPHGKPTDKKIENGDFLTMDYGALKCGYCSDMTRTVMVGEPSAEQREVYELVLRAHLESMAAAKPGARCSDIDKIARDIIYSAGYEGCFGHGLGHSLGREIHEDPRFSQSCATLLEPGMVMTVEPGVYLAGKFGVRIENMIAITESGYENLTNSPRELVVL
ncbi:MAG: Xaa-Pro peptidase family protein [Oscillospiraceae bacterium]|nr:Xaa-Pro peptidase family protein [Oscillospiraceae bacterium]